MKNIRWFLWYWYRPKVIRDIAKKYKPWIEYTLKETGQKCHLTSIFEDGTVSCFCWYEWSGPQLGYGVFGIDPNSLTPPTDGVKTDE